MSGEESETDGPVTTNKRKMPAGKSLETDDVYELMGVAVKTKEAKREAKAERYEKRVAEKR